jgi:transcriptional regulator with XRE-family HTH domain
VGRLVPANFNQSDVMAVIKNACAAHGLTQARVAKLLRVSVPTVKRWFAGKGVGVDQLVRLMDLVNMSFSDIAVLLPVRATSRFQYSLEQEEFFADNPGHLAFFDQLVNGLKANRIQQLYKLTQRSLRRYLRELESLGLIEVFENSRVKIIPEGSPAWRINGPLDRAFGRQAVFDFVDQELDKSLTLYLHRYTKEDRNLVLQKVDELATIATQANNRAKIAGMTDRSFGLLLGFGKFELKTLKEIPDLH